MKTYPDRNAMIRTLAPDSIVAEIGTQRGDFAAEILKTNPYRLYLIDVWAHQKGDYEADVANVDDGGQQANYRYVCERFAREIETGQVVVMRMSSIEAASKIADDVLDAVYLDANHTKRAVSEDLRAWAPKVNGLGVIMGHDYTDRPEALKMKFGVIEAVTEFCEEGQWKLVGLTKDEWPSYELERV